MQSRLTARRKLEIYPIFLPSGALSVGRLNTYDGELIFERALRTPAKHPAFSVAGDPPLVDSQIAIDEDLRDSRGRSAHFAEFGLVGHRGRIENDQIRVEALPYQPLAFQAQELRRQRGHLADRLLQRQDPFFPNVAAEHPRKGSVEAGMDTILGAEGGQAVGADHAVGILHDARDIPLVHAAENRTGRRLVIADEIEGNVQGITVFFQGDLGQTAAGPFRPAGRAGDKDAPVAYAADNVFPVGARGRLRSRFEPHGGNRLP